MSCGCCATMPNRPCGCCDGTQNITPLDVSNRPGLSALTYRVGTHPTFLETMQAGLSAGSPAIRALGTREAGDPAIALLDAWATVGDVLTFYQERIANEGYLRTATERRSVVELARLVGYKPRPGVSSSVYLAFTLQKDFNTLIPWGTGAKTSPGQGQTPQTFETSSSIDARSVWNEIAPRRTNPQDINSNNANDLAQIWFTGSSTRLKPNDLLLIVLPPDNRRVTRRVAAVEEDHKNQRTKVTLQAEEFSATGFLQALQKLLQGWIAASPIAAKSASIAALLTKQEAVKPLTDLDADVADTVDKLGQLGSGVTAANLKLLQTATGSLHDALNAFLNASNPKLQSNVDAVRQGYQAQDVHATNVDTALVNLKNGALDALSSRITSLLAANTALTAEAQEVDPFKVLAKTIQSLSTQWVTPLKNLDAEMEADLKSAVAGIAAAEASANAVANPGMPAALTGIHDTLNLADGKSANVKAAALEKAANDLGALAPVIPEVTAEIGALANALTKGGKKVDAIVVLADNSELEITVANRSAMTQVAGVVAALENQMKGSLRAQSKAILDAANAIQSVAQQLPFGLLSDRVDEFLGALHDAHTNVGPLGIDLVVAATPLPPGFPPGSPEEQREEEVAGFLTPLAGSASAEELVSRGETAIRSLADELPAIDQDIKDLANASAVLTAISSDLKALNARYRGMWQALMTQLATTYQNRPGSIPAVLSSVVALNVSGPLKAAAVNAQKALDAMDHPPVGAWLTDLESDLRDDIAKLTGASGGSGATGPDQSSFGLLGDVASNLGKKAVTGATKELSLAEAFGKTSDVVARSLIAMRPDLGDRLFAGWGTKRVDLSAAQVFAFRVKASLFGHSAPTLKATVVTNPNATTEVVVIQDGGDPVFKEQPNIVNLDGSFDQITPNSWLALQMPAAAVAGAAAPAPGQIGDPIRVLQVANANAAVSVARYGVSGKTTEIVLTEPWFEGAPTFTLIRRTGAYAQSELLPLAENPIDSPVGNFDRSVFDFADFQPDKLELDGFFDGLAAGRSVVVSGERTDVPGVVTSEVAQVIDVQQNINDKLPGDSLHTMLSLATALQFGYKRGTVKVNANVARATHGETQKEVLGSGDGSQGFQRFKLHHLPLTYLPAPTPTGGASQLQVRVNDVLWREADNLEFLGPRDRQYAIAIEDDGTTTVTFGDGANGARLPTGVENIRAVYRNGIGSPGNVPEKQIAILPSPPLGITGVTNPAAATGGADPETIEQARSNAPLAVKALDRLISVQDYADFARTYAGIAKAAAVKEGGLVRVVVAGNDDNPIDLNSDLMLNLNQSMRNFGDPHQPFRVDLRKLKLLVMSASVASDPDYDWIPLKAKIRQAVLDRFGFDQRDLGQFALLSVANAAMQRIPGVLYVKVDLFGFITGTLAPADILADIAKIKTAPSRILIDPDEIAYFAPSLPETLILNNIQPEDGQ